MLTQWVCMLELHQGDVVHPLPGLDRGRLRVKSFLKTTRGGGVGTG
jgi:hypothetical protein